MVYSKIIYAFESLLGKMAFCSFYIVTHSLTRTYIVNLSQGFLSLKGQESCAPAGPHSRMALLRSSFSTAVYSVLYTILAADLPREILSVVPGRPAREDVRGSWNGGALHAQQVVLQEPTNQMTKGLLYSCVPSPNTNATDLHCSLLFTHLIPIFGNFVAATECK